jgi:hypothetical protein
MKFTMKEITVTITPAADTMVFVATCAEYPLLEGRASWRAQAAANLANEIRRYADFNSGPTTETVEVPVPFDEAPSV